jgi:hypothetical protein
VLAAERAAHVFGRSLGGAAPPVATERDVMLRALQLLRRPGVDAGAERRPDPRLAPILALGVPVVCDAADCGARPGETVVVCGPDGKRTHGFAVDLLDRDALVQRVGGVLLDPATVAARQAAMPPDAAKLLERRTRLQAAARDGSEAAAAAGSQLGELRASLVTQLTAIAPALVSFAGGELRLDPELAMLEHQRPPLGLEQQYVDPCPPCGMGFTSPQLNTLLRLAGR